MREKQLIFTKIIECPVPGCKRGFLTEIIDDCNTFYCPEHHKAFSAILMDQDGKKYRLVREFGIDKEKS